MNRRESLKLMGATAVAPFLNTNLFSYPTGVIVDYNEDYVDRNMNSLYKREIKHQNINPEFVTSANLNSDGSLTVKLLRTEEGAEYDPDADFFNPEPVFDGDEIVFDDVKITDWKILVDDGSIITPKNVTSNELAISDQEMEIIASVYA